MEKIYHIPIIFDKSKQFHLVIFVTSGWGFEYCYICFHNYSKEPAWKPTACRYR